VVERPLQEEEEGQEHGADDNTVAPSRTSKLTPRLALRSPRVPRSSLGKDGRISAVLRLRRGRFLPPGLALLARPRTPC
jgi:hypothetical protein